LYCLLEEIPKLKTDSDTEVTKLTYILFIICCCSDVTLCYHGFRFSNQTPSYQCHGNASIAKTIDIAIAILFKFCIGIAIAITFAASIVTRAYSKGGVQPKCGVQNQSCGAQRSILWSPY
jgi:hypothetical protein